jgi:hypothetical protein
MLESRRAATDYATMARQICHVGDDDLPMRTGPDIR